MTRASLLLILTTFVQICSVFCERAPRTASKISDIKACEYFMLYHLEGNLILEFGDFLCWLPGGHWNFFLFQTF